MSKTLLLEHHPFKPKLKVNGDILVVSGIIQRANARNHNGRIYPIDVLKEQVAKYSQEQIAERRAMGELDHTDEQVINLKNVSHNITKLWWEGDDLMGELEILPTPSGNIARKLLEAKINVGISSRALGSVSQIDESTVEVQNDLELICWDLVSTPSTHGAFITPLNEGVSLPVQKYTKINGLVRDIICLNTDSCSL